MNSSRLASKKIELTYGLPDEISFSIPPSALLRGCSFYCRGCINTRWLYTKSMAQVKVYGIKEQLIPIRETLSDVIHTCIVEALVFPEDKRAHRFFPMEKENMFYPSGRSDAYTIIEITMIEGRSIESRKKLIRLLFDKIQSEVGITYQDIEICILESPAHNWGFRGMHGDEIKLNYKIEV